MSNFGPKLKSSVQPILLQGHERSITKFKYNQDGDLMFSASKDLAPCIWYADTGERIGTYGQHKGAVWDIDPSWDSQFVLTACADGVARLFETTTGEIIFRMPHRGPVRAVAWSESNKLFCTASDPYTSRDPGLISVFEYPDDETLAGAINPQDNAPSHTPILEIPIAGVNNKATCLAWSMANKYIIAGFDNGMVAKFDPITGEEVARSLVHKDRVNCLNFNSDKTLFITGSKDTTARLFDPETLEVLKTYQTDRPVNGAVISPLHPHVIIGGGQDAMSVTVTKASSGKFESRLFHMIYEHEFGRIAGHFGPINSIAIHPSGKSYTSGAEDGFMRLHHFDNAYLNYTDLIPSDLKESLKV